MMETMKFYITISLIVLLPMVKTGRILLMPSQMVSHVVEQTAVGEALVARGHTLYMLLDASYPLMAPVQKAGITPILYQEPKGVQTIITHMNGNRGERIFKESSHVTQEIIEIAAICESDCERLYANNVLMGDLISLELDLVIVDGFLLQMCNFVLPILLKVPYVYMFSHMAGLNIGNPSLPSFVSPGFSPYTDRMTFFERLKNVYITVIYARISLIYHDSSKFEKYTNGQSLLEIMRRSELFIVTRDELLEWPEPSLPNVLRVPGISARKPRDLPSKLKHLADSKQALAVVTFGSSIEVFPEEVMAKFLTAFEDVDELTFLFRVNNKLQVIKNLPKNVILLDWLPQQDLLGQNNTKLFITHCGNNGQYEAVYHGVPMIGFPLFAEQPHNGVRMVDKGIGMTMNIHKFTAHNLSANIKLVLKTPDFTNNVQRLSAIMKSGNLPSVFVAEKIEHVIRFGGSHLKSSAHEMPLYQLLMLDIVAFLLLVLFIGFIILGKLFVWCLNKLFLTQHNI